jgi:hypothetical protein
MVPNAVLNPQEPHSDPHLQQEQSVHHSYPLLASFKRVPIKTLYTCSLVPPRRI